MYQDVATFYEVNSSSYAKDVSFSFDTSKSINVISNKSLKYLRIDSDIFFEVTELLPAKDDVSTDYVIFPVMLG